MGNIGLFFLGVLLFLTSLFMMLLILVQRGKGGGLTGALGGMGGQSAFGAKAGDVFTRITVVTAIVWITLCMITIAAFNPPPSSAGLNDRDDVPTMSSGEDEESSEEGGMSAGVDSASDEESADPSNDLDPNSLDEQAKDLVDDVTGETAENEGSSTSSTTDSSEETDDSEGSGESSDSGDNN